MQNYIQKNQTMRGIEIYKIKLNKRLPINDDL